MDAIPTIGHVNIERINEGDKDHSIAGDGSGNLSLRHDTLTLNTEAQYFLPAPSIIDRLPNEIVSVVFAMYASNLAQKASPFTLGAVCHRWRELAWSTQEVWSNLVAYFGNFRGGPKLSEARLQLIREWLGRSGEAPLTIEIAANWVDDEQLSRGRELIKLVNSYCDRWYSLKLHLPWTVLEVLDASTCTLSREIHQLFLFTDDERAFLPLSQLAPRIVKIGCMQLDFPSLDWSSVTDIRISNSPVHRILRLLQLAPNLLQANFPFAGCSEDDPSASYVQVTHTKLRTLEMDFSENTAQLFFDNATLPALEELVLEASNVNLTANLLSFFDRSSCRLRKLSVPEADYAPSLVDIARSSPSLTAIHVTGGSVAAQPLEQFFRALIEHLPSEEAAAPPSVGPILPSLSIFEWSGRTNFPWHVLPNLFTPLSVNDNHGRRPLKLVSIKPHLHRRDPIPVIDPQVLQQLLPFTEECLFNFPTNRDDDRLSILVLSLCNLAAHPELDSA